MNKFALLASSAAMALVSVAAHADTFTFSFTGQDNGSGTFTTGADQGGGKYLITGISGTFNKFDIVGLLNPGTYPVVLGSNPPDNSIANDNLLFVPKQDGGYLDFNGVSFTISNNNRSINIYYDGTQNYFAVKGANQQLDTLDTFKVSRVAATPEPSSLALLGTGIVGAVGVVRRRLAR